MSYHFSNFLLLRMPVFPLNYAESSLAQLLADPQLRSALLVASPVFYRKLFNIGFDPEQLTPKELLTLRKYINRASYRPTPFGLFASINSCSWSAATHLTAGGNDGFTAHMSPDQLFSRHAAEHLLTVHKMLISYEPNPTIYRVQRSYRFIRSEIDAAHKRVYQLQSVGASLVMQDLFKFCRNGRHYGHILKRIIVKTGCTLAEAADYFEFLTDTQLLLPVLRAHINGIEHLQSLSKNNDIEITHELHTLLGLLGQRQPPSVGYLKKVNGQIQQLFKQKDKSDQQTGINVILQRKLAGASLSSRYQQMIRDGLFALHCLCPQQEIATLNQFRQHFQRHFEGQRIPLLHALDPERGIGYQQNATSPNNELLETVHIYRRTRPADNGNWQKAHAYLLRRWLDAERSGERVITLHQKELEEIGSTSIASPTLGFSVLFRIAGETLFLESAGGTNATAMLGRFTVADPQIAASAREMARQVEELNPDIIFAELLHLTDPHTDNINRRKQIWTYELPLTAAAEPDSATRLLRLDDLYVEIKDQKIMLWSKSNNKYVVPRSTSAYNHNIDQLPIFRFLADLSHQYAANHSQFELADYFPGLSSYPRVSYKGTIIGLATWLFTKADIADLLSADVQDLPDVFSRFAAAYHLPPLYCFSEGDQQLVFNRDRPEDARFFVETVRSKEKIKVAEFLGTDETSLFRDSRGRPYLTQFNAYLIPSRQLDLPEPGIPMGQTKLKRKFIPGSEWLYLKVYLPHLTADRILLKVWPLLKKRYPQGKITQWFFIRYEDDAPHIRLRLKLDPLAINSVLIAFRELLEDHIHQQVIREYQLDTYNRELERYFAGGIEATERFFAASSHFVLCYLSTMRRGAVMPAHIVALVSTQMILNCLVPQSDDRLNLVKQAYEGLASEFEGQRMKYELDQKFRNLRPTITAVLNEPYPFGSGILERACKALLQAASALKPAMNKCPIERTSYIQSILHMHMNRVFTDQQRKQEMLIYYMLYKWQTGMMAKR